MKTSLVIKVSGGTELDRYARVSPPAEAGSIGDAAHYFPAHIAKGSRHLPNGKIKHEWKEPEAVSTRYYVFHPKRGKLDRIRRMPEDKKAVLDLIDKERDDLREKIKALTKTENEILAQAWKAGEVIGIEEARTWTSQPVKQESEIPKT